MCSYTVSGLKPGTTYYFTVTSYDIAGNSNDYSASCTLTAVPRPAAYIPVIKLFQPSITEINVSWDLPSAEDYPFIQTMEVFVNGECKKTYSASNGAGECYTENSCTVTVNPRTLYEVYVKLTEASDESVVQSESESNHLELFTQPEYQLEFDSDNNKDGSEIPYYRYSNELKLKLKMLTQGVNDSDYKVHAEYMPVDSDGNDQLASALHQVLVKDSALALYPLSGLEPDTTYRIKIYTSVKDGEHESYSYLNARETMCTTAPRKRAERGYFCYSEGSSIKYYHDVQPAGYTGSLLGIVCEVDSFGEPEVIMALKDEKESSEAYIAPDYESALSRAKNCVDGGLSWSLPSKEIIETIFNTELRDIVFDSIHKAVGTDGEFAPSDIDELGSLSGRYVTSSETPDGKVYAFDMDGMQCSPAVPVSPKNRFRVRLFALL